MYDESHKSEANHSLSRNYSSCPSAQPSDILTSRLKPSTPTNEGFLPLTASPPSIHPPASLSELPMGALSSLQTQFQLNTVALEMQRKAFDNLSQTVGHLSNDVADLRKGLISHPTSTQATSPGGISDTVVGSSANNADRLANNTGSLVNKVSEVDSLGAQLEIVKRRIKDIEKTIPITACPPNSIVPRGSSSSTATPGETGQTLQPSQHGTNSGSTLISGNRKRQNSGVVDSPTDTQSKTSGPSKKQKSAHVESHVGSELASVSSPVRHGMVEANGRGLHAEAMCEQRRHVASTSDTSAWRTNGVKNPKDGHTVRHSSQGSRHMAERSDARTGKAEWRPIRNADGVLLRKDGTPDMRSPLNRFRASQS